VSGIFIIMQDETPLNMFYKCIRLGVFTLVNSENVVFWHATSCCLVDGNYELKLHKWN
jgi:hypothetical protein